MIARLDVTLSHTSVWLLVLACLISPPAHAESFHWRDILRDAARDTMREYQAPDRRSDERGYRADDPQDRYYRWREQREADWRQREGAAARARQEEQAREEAQRLAQQQREEAERAKQEAEQRRQAAAERKRQLQIEQQRGEAAERERQEQERQRLEALQQAQQRAAQQARLEWERQQQAQRAYQQERQLRELARLSRLWTERALWLALGAGFLALLVPAYRYWLEGRASAEGLRAVAGGKKLLSLACLVGFLWASTLGIVSPEGEFVILALAWAGLPGIFFLPGILLLVFEYLHYCFVPHPMESPVRRAMTEHDPSKVRLGDVTDAMFDHERDDLPPKWQSENYARRLDALEKRIRGEKAAADSLSEYVRKKSQEQAR